MLFTVPNAGDTVKVIWVMLSYNLFYSFAYTIFNMSHGLMVPLSTRDSTARGGLSVFNQITTIMMSGILVALIFPMLIMPAIGADKSKWILPGSSGVEDQRPDGRHGHVHLQHHRGGHGGHHDGRVQLAAGQGRLSGPHHGGQRLGSHLRAPGQRLDGASGAGESEARRGRRHDHRHEAARRRQLGNLLRLCEA